MTNSTRIERDSMGELQVPADALWGAQTQRAVQNFPISGIALPSAFIAALGLVKQAAARANAALGLIPSNLARAIDVAAAEVAAGQHDAQFPIDVFQTGSGTSTNMNANEVIAHLASRHLGRAVHANDDINMSQSSNDVIPTTIHVSAALAVERTLLPALQRFFLDSVQFSVIGAGRFAFDTGAACLVEPGAQRLGLTSSDVLAGALGNDRIEADGYL